MMRCSGGSPPTPTGCRAEAGAAVHRFHEHQDEAPPLGLVDLSGSEPVDAFNMRPVSDVRPPILPIPQWMRWLPWPPAARRAIGPAARRFALDLRVAAVRYCTCSWWRVLSVGQALIDGDPRVMRLGPRGRAAPEKIG